MTELFKELFGNVFECFRIIQGIIRNFTTKMAYRHFGTSQQNCFDERLRLESGAKFEIGIVWHFGYAANGEVCFILGR